MSDEVQYSRPPIIEGVIDFVLKASLSDREIERIQNKVKKRYTNVEDEQNFEVTFNADRIDTKVSLLGRKMTSANGSDIILVRRNNITTCRLAPYTDWPDFSAKARENLEIAQKVLGNFELVRVGVKFVNRIDIPNEEIFGQDLAGFFNIGVNLPGGMAQSIGSFSVAVDMIEARSGNRVVMNCGTVAPVLIDHVSVLLDIDILIESEIPRDNDALWRKLDEIRPIKNRIFESLITEKTRNLLR